MKKYYVGLDVSLEETAVCITDQSGEIMKEGMVSTDPKSIGSYLQSSGLPLERVGMEASNLSIWLYHELSAAGLPITVIETRHAKAALAAQQVKTDRNDARGIAHIMRTGWYKTVHVKSDASQRLQMLLVNRRFLVEQRVALENQIRGSLKTFGLKTGKTTVRQYDARIKELIGQDGELEAGIMPLLEARTVILKKIDELTKMLMTGAQNDDVCRRLMTVPGVGPMTALTYKSSIDDPSRFRRSRHVPPHLGLTPRKYASGEVEYDGRITKCGDDVLRTHLYEAAAYILRPSSKANRLKSWGLRIAKRGGTKKARIAVSRKLAKVMHRIWIDGTEFDYGTAPDRKIEAAA